MVDHLSCGELFDCRWFKSLLIPLDEEVLRVNEQVNKESQEEDPILVSENVGVSFLFTEGPEVFANTQDQHDQIKQVQWDQVPPVVDSEFSSSIVSDKDENESERNRYEPH